MQFTYEAYENLVKSLIINGYDIKNYHNWEDSEKCVILRHDVDTSIDKAVSLAEIENELNVQSTYYFLLKTDFYNIASKDSLNKILKIAELGHEIGLHFDEKSYEEIDEKNISELILKEISIMSDLLDYHVSTVSMHRPSQRTLEANYMIPGVVNSYGETFFREFKYLSDSRMNWREPVEEIVQSQEYNRLHILTHAFWYDEQESDISYIISSFINAARNDRYDNLNKNVRDLDQIITFK